MSSLLSVSDFVHVCTLLSARSAMATTSLPAELNVTSIVFKDYVNDGVPQPETFQVKEDKLSSAISDGSALLEVLYLSVDPYMRIRMKDMKSYFTPFTPGAPMSGGGVAVVRSSKAEGFKEGELVVGMLPWSSFCVLDKKSLAMVQKVDPSLVGQVPLSYFLGTLGMPGLTAYVGIHMIAEPKEGETVFISAAAGAVGQVAGQLFKHVHGCKVVGSVGSADKVELLKDLGFDAAFNYRTTSTDDAFKQYMPEGIDIYFENVGGEILDLVLEHANQHARIVACGTVSQYNLSKEERYGIKNIFQIVGKEIKMQGFIVSSSMAKYGADFARDMAGYIKSGKVKVKEHMTEGIENMGQAFLEMMKGGNVGKAVVKVVDKDPFPTVQ